MVSIHEKINSREQYSKYASHYMQELRRVMRDLDNIGTWTMDKIYAKYYLEYMIRHFYRMIHSGYLSRNEYLMPEINLENTKKTEYKYSDM